MLDCIVMRRCTLKRKKNLEVQGVEIVEDAHE